MARQVSNTLGLFRKEVMHCNKTSQIALTLSTCWNKYGAFNRPQNMQNKWIWNISENQQCLQDNVYSSLPKCGVKT